MKTILFIGALFGLTTGLAYAASSVTKDSTWSKTYSVTSSEPRLKISNVWGSVRVRPGKNGEIVVSVEEVRTAPNQALFDKSLELLKLNVEAGEDAVSLRVGNPEEHWNKSSHCDGCRVDYQFDVQVPANTIIDVGTVMDGLVDVGNIKGAVTASNVNGSVKVRDIHNCSTIKSVNGTVDVGFESAPDRDCSLETINGDVTLSLPANTNLDVAVDLFNGDVMSDFQVKSFAVPTQVEYKTEDGRHRYSIKQLTGIRIGDDGPVYSIASINGDVRIRKNQ